MIRALKRYILWALCLGLFAWMLWQANPRQLWQNLLDWNWILLGCIGVWLVGYLLNAASFRCILRCFSADEGLKDGASFQGKEGMYALMRSISDSDKKVWVCLTALSHILTSSFVSPLFDVFVISLIIVLPSVLPLPFLSRHKII